MTDHERYHASEILNRAARGDSGADRELSAMLYGQLRDLAGGQMRRERRSHTLQPTALVHEVYLRLMDQSKLVWKDRRHFLRIAAREMRRVLVDHGRASKAAKRGRGWERTLLDQVVVPAEGDDFEWMDLEAALKTLADHDKRLAQVVELRFFAGLTVPETAEVLEVSSGTVERDWRLARARLYRYLHDQTDR